MCRLGVHHAPPDGERVTRRLVAWRDPLPGLAARRDPGRGLAPLVALAAAAFLAGCASSPKPRLSMPEPDLTLVAPVDVARQEALARFERALVELEEGNPDAAYEDLLQVADRCGRAPLGQQALLMVAIAQLDPTSPDQRIHLAAQAAAHLARWTPDTTWIHRTAEVLYLLSRKLAPPANHLHAMDVDALGARLERAREGADAGTDPAAAGTDRTAAGTDPTAGTCSAAWPDGTDRPGNLPELEETPLPAQIARLRSELSVLRQEVERLRRLIGRKEPAP